AAEAAIFLLISLPSPKVLKTRLVSLISLILQPLMFIVPFAAFQLLDIYWKYEHRLTCTSEIGTATERDRYEKSKTEDALELDSPLRSGKNGPSYCCLLCNYHSGNGYFFCNSDWRTR
ncbi:hypothetical protein SOVF_203740, partial [Spinacia oleracea]